jgi:hypothetical protein
MTGPIFRYLADDHRRLEDALRRATSNSEQINPAAYLEFRGGLLRHISMEEKILLPAARAARGGQPLEAAPRLRLDHGALAALLVLTPTKPIVATIRTILNFHNSLEEGPQGVYAQCEVMTGFDANGLLARLQNTPAVPMNAYVDNPIAVKSARDALRRAGYDLKE